MLSMLAQGKLYVGTRTELYTIGIGPLVDAGWGGMVLLAMYVLPHNFYH